jgi:hypothetical protein
MFERDPGASFFRMHPGSPAEPVLAAWASPPTASPRSSAWPPAAGNPPTPGTTWGPGSNGEILVGYRLTSACKAFGVRELITAATGSYRFARYVVGVVISEADAGPALVQVSDIRCFFGQDYRDP